jgi:hypothetical protein
MIYKQDEANSRQPEVQTVSTADYAPRLLANTGSKPEPTTVKTDMFSAKFEGSAVEPPVLIGVDVITKHFLKDLLECLNLLLSKRHILRFLLGATE